MYAKITLIAAIVAAVEARFAQEQIPVAAVQALSAFGSPGASGTLSGRVPGVLLAGANACDKLKLGDDIVTQLGTDPQVIEAAKGVVGGEKNTNQFVNVIPVLCGDASLPKTPELRGIPPLVDPAVIGSDVENANSKLALTNPFNADGLSVAEVAAANGFTNFTVQNADGSKGAEPAGGAAPAAAASADTATASAAVASCAGAAAPAASTAAADTGAASDAGADSAAGASGAVVNGVQQSTVAGLDFGLCVPTMKFEAGLNGRKETEFTFQAIDPIVNKGQQEALNPNIITNRICDQLTNVCNANAAAKAACLDAKSQISALGTRDADTANQWNTILGFEGTDINPDNAPQPGLVGHT